MPKTKRGSTVELDVEVLDSDGEVVECNDPEELLIIELGAGELPPSVEEALTGISVGDSIDVLCAAGEAFGGYSPEAIVAVPREDFPDDLEIEKGMAVGVTVEDDDGGSSEIDAHVIEVNPDAVILDANHPLAGKEARFRVVLRAIQE